ASEGPYNNASFVGPAGCALLYSGAFTAQLTDYYQRTNAFNVTESYYNGSLQLLSMLLMTGNFHNLRQIGPPDPTPTFTPIPDGQIIDSFEDYAPYYNTQNDWGGYWYTIASPAGYATIYPPSGSHLTMTAGGAFAGSNYYLRVTGTKAAAIPASNIYPSVGFGTELRQNAVAQGLSVDLRPFGPSGANGGIRFWVRGDGVTPYKVALTPKGTGTTIHLDWAVYQYTWIPPATWTQAAILFSDFTQPGWTGETYPIDTVLAIMQQIQWQNGTDNAIASVNLSVDHVELFPYLWTPTPLPTMTFTRTSTRTPTVTITPTFGCSEMLDNCEDMNNINNWGGIWYTYDDNAAGCPTSCGTSYVMPRSGLGFYMQSPGVTGSTAGAARITGFVTSSYEYGFIGMGTKMSAVPGDVSSVNCTGFTGIRFWAKGNGSLYRVQLVPSTAVNDGNDHYTCSFIAPTTWTQYQFFFTGTNPSFSQSGYGPAIPINTILANLNAIHFQTWEVPMESVDLWIDNIEMFPCQVAWTRTPTATPPATFTQTATPTPTFSRTPTITNTVPPATYTFTRTMTYTYT
ncbi:MAG TPA: carbohydrate binding domain-containing protein, partial [Candidatus Goldiibacteriota bacterium]|nr:carbohydrate binding domain-containing protein [Candidatus Goldiibacteriota bacterium]